MGFCLFVFLASEPLESILVSFFLFFFFFFLIFYMDNGCWGAFPPQPLWSVRSLRLLSHCVMIYVQSISLSSFSVVLSDR